MNELPPEKESDDERQGAQNASSPKNSKADTKACLTGPMIEFAENLVAVCLTLGLCKHELCQPKLSLSHIKLLAVTLGNETSHCRNMVVPLDDVLFDVGQQK